MAAIKIKRKSSRPGEFRFSDGDFHLSVSRLIDGSLSISLKHSADFDIMLSEDNLEPVFIASSSDDNSSVSFTHIPY